MKIIDLLNKIANGEEVPKKIKYHSDIYSIYYDSWYRYYDEKGNRHDFLNVLYEDFSNLNDEVEILEEEKKIPEKLDRELNCTDDTLRGLVASVNEIYKEIADKINETIDYLKSKGE